MLNCNEQTGCGNERHGLIAFYLSCLQPVIESRVADQVHEKTVSHFFSLAQDLQVLFSGAGLSN